MAYILTAERDAEDLPYEAFARYKEYLDSVREPFPPGAYALATSDWYFSLSDHRSPHDAWLEEARLVEARLVEVAAPGERAKRSLDLHVRLLGAYHDGWIDLHYRDVSRYHLVLQPRPRAPRGDGHRDWRYDEFRVTPDGRVEHEIEWWSADPTATWLIEAADVSHRWLPWAAAGVPPAAGV